MTAQAGVRNQRIGMGAPGAVLYAAWRPVQRFGRWWVGELVAMLPYRVRYLLGLESSILVIDVTPPQLEVRLWQGRRCEALGTLRIVKSADHAAESDPIVRRAARTDAVVLRLPEDQVLQLDVTLPLAAEDNLREVLGFEMDRLTPFNREMVAYDYVKVGRDPAQGVVRLKLFVITKSKLQLLVARLAALGIQATAVTTYRSPDEQGMPEFPAQPNLLTETPGSRSRSPVRYLAYASSALVLVLAIVALALPLWNQQRYIAGLEQAIEAVQADVKNSKRLAGELDRVVKDAEFIAAKKRDEPMAIGLVNELTQLVPDGTWLHRLEIKGGQIRVQGESVNAAPVLSTIENSGRFAETQFASPVVRNSSTGTERFSILTRGTTLRAGP